MESSKPTSKLESPLAPSLAELKQAFLAAREAYRKARRDELLSLPEHEQKALWVRYAMISLNNGQRLYEGSPISTAVVPSSFCGEDFGEPI